MLKFFNKKNEDTPPSNADEAKKLIQKLGSVRGGEIIRSAAMSGNLFCQTFLYHAWFVLPEDKKTEKLKQDVELFMGMAASSGDADSQFNFGKWHIAKVANKQRFDQIDIDNLKKAKYWLELAASQVGSTSSKAAKEFLKNLEVFDFLK